MMVRYANAVFQAAIALLAALTLFSATAIANETTLGTGFDNGLLMTDVTTRRLQDFTGESYPEGTEVRYEFEDDWKEGTIIRFDTETNSYTIEWQDGQTDEYTDIDAVDEMVDNAANWNGDGAGLQGGDSDNGEPEVYNEVDADLVEGEPWEIDTPVLLQFPDGWYEGFITDFHMQNETIATYQITWNDGSVMEYTDLQQVDNMVANARDYEPWEAGTQVVGQVGEEWKEGFISSFANGVYVIEWSDGAVQEYLDFDTVDDFVYNARGNDDAAGGGQGKDGVVGVENNDYISEVYEQGTPVSYVFDDGWHDGIISGYEDGVYEVTWSDGSTNRYSDFDMIEEMVDNAQIPLPDSDGDQNIGENEGQGGDTDDDRHKRVYGVGTMVCKEFKVGWWVGFVASYGDGIYTVRWVDGSAEDIEEGEEMDQIVADAQNVRNNEDADAYPAGTVVYKKFSDGWKKGTITAYKNYMYSVTWEGGDETYYVQGIEMDQMVANGVKVTHASTGGNGVEVTWASSNGNGVEATKASGLATGGKIGIAMAALAGVSLLGVGVLVLHRRSHRKKVSSRENLRMRYDTEELHRNDYGLSRIL